MKIYSFNVSEGSIPSTPTLVAFVKSMLMLKKHGSETFTGLEVMTNALNLGLWTTKQDTDKKMMTTWAYYLKTLKEVGLEECGNTGSSKKEAVSIEDLIDELE